MKYFFILLLFGCMIAEMIPQQILYAQDPPIENPRLNPQLMRKGVDPTLLSRFRSNRVNAVANVPKDWKHWIDSAWGPGLSTTDKLNIFDAFWNIVDQQYGGFPNLNVNWDSLRSHYRPLVAAGVSRGRFLGIMSRMFLALQEVHTWARDQGVDSSFYFDDLGGIYFWPKERVPLIMFGGWGVTTSGAGVSPMPDTSLFVYRAQPGHPLGIQAGDIILGYDGKKWKDILREFDSAEVPVSKNFSVIGTDPESYTYSRLNAASMNWWMFDTIDVVRYSTGDTVHLSTRPLADAPMFWDSLMCMDEIPVPGVSMPDAFSDNWCSWGIVQGTTIGYIYLWDLHNPGVAVQFARAVQNLMHTTTGLIIDIRSNWGGYPSYCNQGFSYLFNANMDINFDIASRSSTSDHFAFSHQATNNHYAFGPFNPTPDIYDHPIAVLTGPGSLSAGDYTAYRLKFHPMARFFGKRTNTAYVDAYYSSGTLVKSPWTHRVSRGSAYSISDGQGYLIHKGFNVDEEVWHNREDAANGVDAVVKRAVEWINTTSYAHDVQMNKDTLSSLSDSIAITARITNPLSHTLVVSAIVTSSAGAQVDSLLLENDGLHGDGSPGDSIWGAFIKCPALLGDYNISVRTQDNTAGSYRRLTNVVRLNVAPNVIVGTNPPGYIVSVDGSAYAGELTFLWASGTTHTISTNSPQGSGSFRLIFLNWSDGGARTHPITVQAGKTIYTANFDLQNKLMTTAYPTGWGSIAAAPASPDGFYNTGTTVQLTAIPSPGYSFAGWSGDLTDTTNPQSIVLIIPRNVTATFSLITHTIMAVHGAHGTISPFDTVTVALGANQRFLITPEEGYVVDTLLVDGIMVDSTEGYTFFNVSTDHTIRVVFRSLTISVEWIARQNWNMISCPVEIVNDSFPILFPTSISKAFSYIPGSGYHSELRMRDGAGYWLKFNTQQPVSMRGAPYGEDTIVVTTGWNMIGSISYPVAVTKIVSDSAGMTTSRFFGYAGTYLQTDTIWPGSGYWVKTNKDGKLILASAPSALSKATRIKIIEDGELPPPPPEGEISNLNPPVADQIPNQFVLEQNYPNPFNPTTEFRYAIREAGFVTLKIYDVLGREVATLVNAEQASGYKSVIWDASNIPSGIYFYTLTARPSEIGHAASFTETRKLLLLK